MATSIEPISFYKYNGTSFVRKNKSFVKILKGSVLAAIFCLAVQPLTLGNSYAQYEPEVVQDPKTKIVEKIQDINPKVKQSEAIKIVDNAFKWASEYGISPSLILAIIAKESMFVIHAIGNGSYGLMQIQMNWHTDKLKDAKKVTGSPEPFNVSTNIYLGTRILKDCTSKYGSVNKALLCYNGSIGTNTTYASDVLKIKKQFDPYI